MTTNDSLFDDDVAPSDDDSAILVQEAFQPELLQVYSTGRVTVVGFGGVMVPPDHNMAQYRDEIHKLIEEHNAEVFAFDLSDIKMIPSGLLGLMMAISRHGVAIELYNPSEDVRNVLSTTHFDQFLTIKELEL